MTHTRLKVKVFLHHHFRDDISRLRHIYSVRKTALDLGKIYKVDDQMLEIAALLHDATKIDAMEKIKKMALLWAGKDALNGVPKGCLHAYSAAYLAKTYFNINHQDLLDAILYHCSGKKAMSPLQQIIYVSDYIEDTRPFVDDQLRTLARKNLDQATLTIINDTINYLQKNKRPLSRLTLEAQLYYKHKTEAMNAYKFETSI